MKEPKCVLVFLLELMGWNSLERIQPDDSLNPYVYRTSKGVKELGGTNPQMVSHLVHLIISLKWMCSYSICPE